MIIGILPGAKGRLSPITRAVVSERPNTDNGWADEEEGYNTSSCVISSEHLRTMYNEWGMNANNAFERKLSSNQEYAAESLDGK